MNLIVLMIIISLLTIVVYHIYDKDLLSPSIWLLFGYALSILIALTKMGSWGDISGNTVAIIVIGTIAFILGGLLTSRVKVKNINHNKVFGEIVFELSFIQLIIVILVMLVTVYLNYRFVKTLAYSGGFTSGTNFLTFARGEMEAGEAMPYSVYIPIVISQVFGYLISHDIVSHIIKKQRNKFLILKLFGILLFLAICILSTGRTMLMHYLLFLLADACLLIKYLNNWSKNSNGKIIKYGVIVIAIILVAFWVIDLNLRSSRYGITRTMWDQIGKYTSSSLYALSNYLESPTFAKKGEYETLYNLLSILNKIGFDFEIKNIALSFTSFANDSTNVYTALRRYIHDFGYIGMFVIQYIVGFSYHLVYRKIKTNRASLFTFIMFCTFIYAPVFNCIEERVLVNILSLRSAMLFVFTYITIKFFARIKQKKKVFPRMKL